MPEPVQQQPQQPTNNQTLDYDPNDFLGGADYDKDDFVTDDASNKSDLRNFQDALTYNPSTWDMIKGTVNKIFGLQPLTPFEGAPPKEAQEFYQSSLTNIASNIPETRDPVIRSRPAWQRYGYGGVRGLAQIIDVLATPENLSLLGAMGIAPDKLHNVANAVFRTHMAIGAGEGVVAVAEPGLIGPERVERGVVAAGSLGMLLMPGRKGKEKEMMEVLEQELRKQAVPEPEKVATKIIENASDEYQLTVDQFTEYLKAGMEKPTAAKGSQTPVQPAKQLTPDDQIRIAYYGTKYDRLVQEWEGKMGAYRNTPQGIEEGGASGKAIGGTYKEINERNAAKKADKYGKLVDRYKAGIADENDIAELEAAYKRLPKDSRKLFDQEAEEARLRAEEQLKQETPAAPAEAPRPAEPEPKAATPETGAKAPWQMTRDEFMAEAKRQYESSPAHSLESTKTEKGKTKYRETPNKVTPEINKMFEDGRRAIVQKAINDGKPVPPEVLADYPDLKPKTAAPETPAESMAKTIAERQEMEAPKRIDYDTSLLKLSDYVNKSEGDVVRFNAKELSKDFPDVEIVMFREKQYQSPTMYDEVQNKIYLNIDRPSDVVSKIINTNNKTEQTMYGLLHEIEHVRRKGQGKENIDYDNPDLAAEISRAGGAEDFINYLKNKNKRPYGDYDPELLAKTIAKMNGEDPVAVDPMVQQARMDKINRVLNGQEEAPTTYLEAMKYLDEATVPDNIPSAPEPPVTGGGGKGKPPTKPPVEPPSSLPPTPDDFPVVRRRGERGMKNPVVTYGDYKELIHTPDLKPKFTGRIMTPVLHVMDKLAETSPWIKRAFYDRFVDSSAAIADHVVLLRNNMRLQAKNLGLKKGWQERVGIYGLAQREGAPEILKANGFKIPETLVPEEMAMYNWFRDQFTDLYYQINEARIISGKQPFPEVPDYWTFNRIFGEFEALGDTPESISFDRIKNYFHPKASPFPYAKQVKKSLRKLDVNAENTFMKYAAYATRHIHETPAIAQCREYLKPFKRKNGETAYDMLQSAPNTYKWLSDFLDFKAGKIPTIFPRGIEKLMREVNKNLTWSMLGLNTRTIGIQPSALVNTYTEIGGKYVALGMKDAGWDIAQRGKGFVMGKPNESLFSKSRHLKYRSAETAYVDAIEGVTSLLRRGQQFIGNKMMWPIKIMDLETARVGFAAGYRYAKNHLGLNEDAAVRWADDLVTRTQGSAADFDLSPIQRHAVGRFVTHFQTFAINNFAWLNRHVLGINNKNMTATDRMKNTTRFVIGTTLSSFFYEDVLNQQSSFPTPITAYRDARENGDDWQHAAIKAASEVGEFVPLWGGAIRFGSSWLGPTAEVGQNIIKSIRDEPFSKDIYDPLAHLLGVPGYRQAKKVVKKIKGDY